MHGRYTIKKCEKSQSGNERKISSSVPFSGGRRFRPRYRYGKNSFHVIGHNDPGAIVLRQKWSRSQVETRLANMRSCLIGMEACAGVPASSIRFAPFCRGAASRCDKGNASCVPSGRAAWPRQSRGTVVNAGSQDNILVGYSITSSASSRIEAGISRPRALVVFALMMNLNSFGCSNGSSCGFAPFRIRSTSAATRSKLSPSSGP